MKRFVDLFTIILLWLTVVLFFTAVMVLLGVLMSGSAHATPDQDAALDQVMYEKGGIKLYPIAHAQAYWVCSQVQAGIHPQYVASQVAANNPTWYYEQAELFVGSAILIYCPPDTRSERV